MATAIEKFEINKHAELFMYFSFVLSMPLFQKKKSKFILIFIYLR